MKKTIATSQPMSPVNIDQSRAIGQDPPEEGSRMGREADKAHGFPGEAEQADDARASATGAADAAPPPSREEAIRHAAYEAYQRRSGDPGSPGNETDDWLEAEARVDRERGAWQAAASGEGGRQ